MWDKFWLAVAAILVSSAAAFGIAFGVVEWRGGETVVVKERTIIERRIETAPTSSSLTNCDRAQEALIEAVNTPGISDQQLRFLAVIALAACERD